MADADVEYYVRWRGEESGPYEPSRVYEMLDEGEVCEWHEVSADRSSWQPVIQVDEIMDEAEGEPMERDTIGAAEGSAPREEERYPEETEEWYYSIDDEIEGPCSAEEVQMMLEEGFISVRDTVCPVDDPDGWTQIANVPRFCEGAGGQQAPPEQQRGDGPIEYAEPEDVAAEGPSPNYGLVALAFIVPLAGFIIGAIYMGKDDPKAQATGKASLIAAVIGLVVGFFIILGIILAGPDVLQNMAAISAGG